MDNYGKQIHEWKKKWEINKVVGEVSQLQTEDDADGFDQLVVVPKKKGRLVGFGQAAVGSSFFAPPPFVDPKVLTAQLKDKDDRISLLETQMAAQQAGYEARGG
ncbi:hypothetical protein Bca52824_081604 [Brassica carinata]|uniref:Uncharacterized protein n=1 Tax=Brassica carinata TaxID=52824 RepID=A0A8X7PIZ9_BRACI|nr:hypothetical protein Bca52824_081604 [Brassica carinata]